MIGIIKKHKSAFLTIIISFIIFVSCYFGISFAEIGSESAMLTTSVSSLINQTMSWDLYKSLTSKGQADCFLHTGSDVQLTIHAVYDIGFDTSKGVMRVYSQVGSSVKTTYTTDSSTIASYIGQLASATSMTGNAKQVAEILKKGFGAAAWLTESSINDTQSAWLDASEANYNTTLNTSYYANYQKMSQTDTEQKTENDDTVTINNVEYAIVGKFKIKFAGQGIASITASNASWTSTSSTDIYWCTSASTKASDWSNNFNQTETSSGSYVLNNKYFYLAINIDKLPEEGQYTVTISQNTFRYYHSRVIVTTGSAGQQTGWYAYAGSSTPVYGSASWTVNVNRYVILTINKIDKKTEQAVSGGLFKLYAKLNDGTEGWISGTIDGEKTLVASASAATEYTSQTEIKYLKKGTYYVYETKAVDGDYGLDNQSGYLDTTYPGGTSITGEFAYIGSKDCTSKSGSVTFTARQRAYGAIQITKYDTTTKDALKGAKFKIYADGLGWLKGDATGAKTYVSDEDDADEYEITSATLNITELLYAKYYVYEVESPSDDYILIDQDGYHSTDNGKAKGYESFESDEDWVYIGYGSVNKSTPISDPLLVSVFNAKAPKLIINKTDEIVTTKALDGAEFKIYAVLKDGTSGWLTGDADAIKSYTASTPDSATPYLAYVEISKLRYGTYYIYETKAPETDTNYVLADQEKYLQKTDEKGNDLPGVSSFSSTDEWVYVGSQELGKDDAGTTVSVDCTNLPEGSIQIGETPDSGTGKVDSITGEALTGAEFKIYAELETTAVDGVKSGWVSGGANDGTLKQYVNYTSASTYTSGEVISRLRYGTYYIYETKAPETNTNYVLADQDGYLQTQDSDGNTLPGTSDLSQAGDEWVYIYSVTVDSQLVKQVSTGYTLDNPYVLPTVENNPEGTIQIGEIGTGEGTGKKDSITGEALTGTEFKIYAVLETTGLDGISSGWVSGGANDGNLKSYVDYSSASTYTSGEIISRLRYGTYYIYETKAPNDNYDLRDQDNYHVTSDADGEAKGYTDFAADEQWVYVGQVTINSSILKQINAGYAVDVPYVTDDVLNSPKAKLEIEKVDQEYNELKLEGAEIVIYAELDSDDIENGWVVGDADDVKTYVTSAADATTYTTDVDGLINISKLNYGTYYIYEIKTPDGYDITKQDGYLDTSAGSWASSLSGDWAYLGSIEIPEGSTDEGIAQNTIIPFEFTGTNIKKVNELEGLVWLDVPDTKGNVGNNLYKENSADQQDEELGNIEVRLYLADANGSYSKIATTYTASDGTYKFSFDPDSSDYCGTEVTYWQLVSAYVEFVYDNTEYVVVDPFVTATNGMDITINSKAQEEEMEADELKDENLTGTTGSYPGLAVTYQGGTLGSATLAELEEILSNNETVISGQSTTDILSQTPLTGYYEKDSSDANHYKVSNINLGLLEKIDPTYTITETLSYAYLTINGYTYTYYYDTPVDGTIEYASTDDLPAEVLKQMNTADYSRTEKVSVYASDIESTVAGVSNMKLYLVYGIYVYNSQCYTTDDVYYEEKLYLTSLTDKYDTNRMELSTDNSNSSKYIGSDQFGLWSGSGGEVTYDLNSSNSNYSSGIGSGETIKTYVQFQVTDTALNKLIYDTSTIIEWNKTNVTTAYSSGYHEYRRTDNLWNHTTSAEARWYNEHKETAYTETNSTGDLYYIHKSESVDVDSGAYYVALMLNEEEISERTITSVVYEDESETETDSDGNVTETGVGNGIIDDDEKNRASGVEVTLLAVSTTNNSDGTVTINTDSEGNIITSTAVLYQLDSNGDVIKNADGTYPEAVTTTNQSGEFTFAGVIPGYYYVQYTYGDGSQKIGYIDENNNFVEVDDLTSNDYRSTIINTNEAGNTIQNAVELQDGEIISYAEALEKYYNGELNDSTAAVILEWYKYLNSTNYNVGVDDISSGSAREIMNSYEYTSQGVYDASGNLVATYKTETDADGNITDIKLTGTSFPLEVTATSPITAVSIENDSETSTEVYDESGIEKTEIHKATFSGLNFGIIKQETDVEVEKVITKTTVTLQQGSTIFSGNAATESSIYATALDTIATKNNLVGSKYIKVELEEDLIYGSAIEVEYTVTITNNTAQAYDSVYWYTYGKQDPAGDTESTVTVNEVVDLLDEKYVVKSLLNSADGTSGEIEQILLDSNGNQITVTTEENVEVNTDSQYTSVSDYYENYTETELYFSGFYAMTSGQSVQMSYSVSGLINSNDDTEYTNQIELTSLSLSGLKSLNTDFEWPWSGGGHTSSGTTVVLTPATGGNKSNTYWIIGAIALVFVAGGVVILKKKVLK